MIKPKQLLPSPEERPDLYDYPDFTSGKPLGEAYLDAVMPEHVKKAIAERRVTLFEE